MSKGIPKWAILKRKENENPKSNTGLSRIIV